MERKQLNRRSFLQIAGAGVAGSLLAACGAASPQPSTGGETSSDPAPAQDPAGSEFVLWGLEYDPHVERYHALAEAFEAKTGYRAIVQPQAWPLETKLLAAMTAGTHPDVVCVMGRVSVPLFQQGAVLVMDDVVYNDAGVDPAEFFFPEAIQAYTWDGHYMGIPLESNQIGPSVGIRYDQLNEVGDEAHALWPASNGQDEFESHEQMWALAELLQHEDGGVVQRWGMSGQGWDLQQLLTTMRSLGMPFWDADQQKFNFDSDEAVTAMQLYIETPVQRGIESQLDDHHMNALFAGKVGVAMGNTSMPGEAAKLGLEVEAVNRPPAIPGEETLYVGEGGWGFEIPARANNMDVALEFAKWMVTREGQVIFAQIYGGVVPSTPTVLDDAIYEGDDMVARSKHRAIDTLPNTVFIGNDWGINVTGATDPLTECRQGVKTAQEACDALQEIMTINYQQWQDSF